MGLISWQVIEYGCAGPSHIVPSLISAIITGIFRLASCSRPARATLLKCSRSTDLQVLFPVLFLWHASLRRYDDRQAGGRHGLTHAAAFFVRHLQLDYIRQFGKFRLQNVARPFDDDLAARAGGDSSEQQQVVKLVKVGVMWNRIAKDKRRSSS